MGEPSINYIVGIKRVFLRETDTNDKPVIESIASDGEDWPGGGGQRGGCL